MKRSLCSVGSSVLALALLICSRGSLAAESADSLRMHNRDQCLRNLHLIYDAIQGYRRVHKELPNTLSDLHPDFISNAEVLICPESRRRALTSIGAAGRRDILDPKTSYLYEFNLAEVRGFRGHTNRDWKRAQMGLLGSVVPIVRCLVHEHPLNLSFGGEIYESPRLEWEQMFTGLVPGASLEPQNLLAASTRVVVIQIPPRDAAASAAELDLSAYYNGTLAKPWLESEPRHDLAGLVPGLRVFNGTRFDVRGVVQLSGAGLMRDGQSFPVMAGPVGINRSCGKLDVLAACALAAKHGTEAGALAIHFSDGSTERFPLICGVSIADAWGSTETAACTVAWQRDPPHPARLFHVVWKNPRPDVPIRSVEMSSASTVGLFIAAISVSG